MSISGTFLIVITTSFLKPLLSTNQSLQTVTDSYVSPIEETDTDSDGVPNLLLTLHFPQLLTGKKDFDLDAKRQFDPWGGKRQSKVVTKDESIGRKRQFSPWGGKRSSSKNFQFADNLTDEDVQQLDILSSGKKRGFNSWGGKRGFNSWGGKRNFNSWGGKRNSNVENVKRFNSWGGKRNFNAWGGKRFVNDLDNNFEVLSIALKNNANMGNKRQAFNSWGGKRTFHSWGGKRSLNSWGGKQSSESEQEPKELDISTYNGITEDIGTNTH